MSVILDTAASEWNRIKSNKRDLVVMLGTPVLYLTLFGFLYFFNAVNHINTVVWDQDNTTLSRTVVEGFNNSDRFNIIGNVETNEELKDMLESGKAKVGIVIPPDFMKEVKKQHPSEVLVCVDGTNLVISNSVFSSAVEIVQTISGGLGVRIMEGSGTLPAKALRTAAPVSFRFRIWYNPTNSYSIFLLLGLLGTTVQQVILLFTSVAIARDKANRMVPQGSLRELAQYVIGKSAPYLVVNFISMNLVLLILTVGFGVPFTGGIPLLLFFEAVFILALVSLGVFISILSRNEMEATQASMMIAVPSFLMSGFTWPLEAMPLPIRIIARSLPLTHFVNGLRDLALKGIGLKYLFPDILFLLALTVVLFPVSVLALKRNTTKSYQKSNFIALSSNVD